MRELKTSTTTRVNLNSCVLVMLPGPSLEMNVEIRFRQIRDKGSNKLFGKLFRQSRFIQIIKGKIAAAG